jgi:hypothetical protein
MLRGIQPSGRPRSSGGAGWDIELRRAAVKALVLTLAVLILSLAACDDNGTGPDDALRRVALTSRDNGRAALFIQREDGTERQRVHFDGVRDDIPGNLPQELLPVRDDRILAIGPVRWSPDGSQLAVVVTVAFDQSQVVVVDADGGNARAASPNTQIILSNVAWSPDGRSIAYTMSTLPHALGIDVFTTDLLQNRVQRVTTNASLGIAGVKLAWSGNAAALFVSRLTGEGGAPLFQPISRIVRITLASGQQNVVAEGLSGEVFGIATDGAWALLLRHTGTTPTGYLEQLVRRSLPGGPESLLTDVPQELAWAALTDGEQTVLFTLPLSGNSDALDFRVVPAAGGSVKTLPGVESGATSADISVRN